jgi:hypothetical protein
MLNRIRRLHLLIVAVILMIGIAAAFVMVLVKPRKNEMAVLDKSIAEKKAIADQETAALAALDDAKKQRSAAEGKWNYIMRTKMSQISLADPYTAIFKVYKEIPTYAPQLTDAFNKNKRVTLSSSLGFPQKIGFKPPDPSMRGMEFPQTLTFHAKSFPDLLSRLKTTDTLPRVMALGNSITLTRTGDGINATIPAVFYIYFVENKAAVQPSGTGVPANVTSGSPRLPGRQLRPGVAPRSPGRPSGPSAAPQLPGAPGGRMGGRGGGRMGPAGR